MWLEKLHSMKICKIKTNLSSYSPVTLTKASNVICLLYVFLKCVCVCMCVCVRGRERESVCACIWKKEEEMSLLYILEYSTMIKVQNLETA